MSTMKRDIVSGCLCMMLGGYIVFKSFDYSMGSLGMMGPGASPAFLGVLLAVVGFFVMFIRTEGIREEVRWRPLAMILVAVTVFGFTVESLGIFGATSLIVILARLAESKASIRSTLALILFMNALVYLVFVLGLSIPFKLNPWG